MLLLSLYLIYCFYCCYVNDDVMAHPCVVMLAVLCFALLLVRIRPLLFAIGMCECECNSQFESNALYIQ